VLFVVYTANIGKGLSLGVMRFGCRIRTANAWESTSFGSTEI
jgi:hypothetical protein